VCSLRPVAIRYEAVDGEQRNSRKEVARQGFLALMNGRAEMVGGDAVTKRTAIEHRFLPETYKPGRGRLRQEQEPSCARHAMGGGGGTPPWCETAAHLLSALASHIETR
jgi:hypothetical protein